MNVKTAERFLNVNYFVKVTELALSVPMYQKWCAAS